MHALPSKALKLVTIIYHKLCYLIYSLHVLMWDPLDYIHAWVVVKLALVVMRELLLIGLHGDFCGTRNDNWVSPKFSM